MSTQPQTQADLMKRVARKIVEEGVNRGDVDVYEEAYASGCVWHGPGQREIRGVKGLKEMVSGYLTAFPDLRMTIEHLVAEDDRLAIHWRCVGTHDGPLGETPATGKKVDIRGHAVLRFERGKVVEEFEIFDELEMLKQIGVVDA